MTLQLAYIGLSLFTTIIIIAIGRKAIKWTFKGQNKVRRKTLFLIIPLILLHIYLFLIAQTGIPQDYSLPPIGLFLLVFPAFLFTAIFIYRNRHTEWLHNIPKHWLVFYQTFRILIETIFVFSVAKGILHPNMTIEGYNYDMIFAISATFIGLWLIKETKIANKIAVLQNYLGLAVIAVIIFIVVTTVYFPEFYGSNKELMPREFGMYPYVLASGFLMPSAVFMHVLSLVQQRKKKPVSDNV